MARKGSLFAHYEILSLIGSGGMGEVFLARDTKLDRNVAIKFLAHDFASQGERLARFVREARAASALSHPNIITIHEIGESNDEHYIVTEHIDGTTLRQRLASPLSFDEVLSIAIQIADALTAAHAGGITHRDIKPENIMLRKDGYLKVLDFGLAKLTESERAESPEAGSTFLVTSPGSFMGTVSYMSPEQARGKDTDARSDIFSFGVVLYEMLTGRLPFPGDNHADVISGILAKDPAPLKTYVADIPDEFQRLVSKALSKDREERYLFTKDLLNDLKNLRDDLRLARRLDQRVEQKFSKVGQMIEPPVSTSSDNVKDSILLTDFENITGEAIFDMTLKTALTFSLGQSPFLDIASETNIANALRQMKRVTNERVTRELAEELCLRLGLKAYLAGSISSLGSVYFLTLEAVNARTGESIGREYEQANSKEEILAALSRAATGIRGRLGESLSSIQRYDRPLDNTTSSFEALKFFTFGQEQSRRGKHLEAIPFFQKALEFDSGFATAYTGLAVIYYNTNQWKLAKAHATKAFELKDSVGEYEKLRISFFYYSLVTGEMDKAISTLQVWRKTYTSSVGSYVNLADCFQRLGQFEQAVLVCRDALNSNLAVPAILYSNLAESLLSLGRFDEVKKICREAFSGNYDAYHFHLCLFQVGYIENDRVLMEENLQWFDDRTDGYLALDLQAGAAAFEGKWRRAQDLSRRAIDLAVRSNAREVAARFAADQVLRIVLWSFASGLPSGEDNQLRTVLKTQTNKALNLERSKEVMTRSALAVACAGQAEEATALAKELQAERPKDTFLNELWLPMIRSALLLQRRKAKESIEELEITGRFERAAGFYPQYLRGLAYLEMKKAEEASREFDKILDHRGEAPLSAIYALARLGKARAMKDKTEYEKFFELWKDADTDMPALTAAREEVERL